MGLADRIRQSQEENAKFLVQQEKAKAEMLNEFSEWASLPYYRKFKAHLDKLIASLDRSDEANPNSLIHLQGQRKALRDVLDFLKSQERKANS